MAGEACALAAEDLIRIARADQSGFCARVAKGCEFRVVERERDMECAVQVWTVPNIAGGFVTLIISNKGEVVKRIGGA